VFAYPKESLALQKKYHEKMSVLIARMTTDEQFSNYEKELVLNEINATKKSILDDVDHNPDLFRSIDHGFEILKLLFIQRCFFSKLKSSELKQIPSFYDSVEAYRFKVRLLTREQMDDGLNIHFNKLHQSQIEYKHDVDSFLKEEKANIERCKTKFANRISTAQTKSCGFGC